MNQDNFWIGKKAKIQILKDGRNLFFTAEILEKDEFQISFKDKYGEVFSFNNNLVNQMELIQ